MYKVALSLALIMGCSACNAWKDAVPENIAVDTIDVPAAATSAVIPATDTARAAGDEMVLSEEGEKVFFTAQHKDSSRTIALTFKLPGDSGLQHFNFTYDDYHDQAFYDTTIGIIRKDGRVKLARYYLSGDSLLILPTIGNYFMCLNFINLRSRQAGMLMTTGLEQLWINEKTGNCVVANSRAFDDKKDSLYFDVRVVPLLRAGKELRQARLYPKSDWPYAAEQQALALKLLR